VLLHFLIISFIVLKYFVVIGTNKINQQQPIEPSLPVEIQGIVYSERVVVKKYTHVKILVKRGCETSKQKGVFKSTCRKMTPFSFS